MKWENEEKEEKEAGRSSLAGQILSSLPRETIKGGREGDVSSFVSLGSC